MKTTTIYVLIALLSGLSYRFIRPFVIAQEPVDKAIIASNLTLTYALFALLVGAFVPSITRRLFPKRFKIMLIPTAMIVGILLVLLLRSTGIDMRF